MKSQKITVIGGAGFLEQMLIVQQIWRCYLG